VSEDAALRRTLAALKKGAVVSRPNQGLPQKAESAVKTAGNWLDEGIKLASQSRFNEAVEAFTQALGLDSGLIAAYVLRGRALRASVSYVTGMGENFSSVTTIGTGGSMVSEEKKAVYDRAIADYNEALRLDPNFAAAYRYRGTAYFNKGNYDKGDYARSRADLEKALQLDPTNASARNLLERLRNMGY
jgi:tetratricopeptide (TPR) repeat protein